MSYYQFNRQEILQKAKERYSKEKVTEYDLQRKRRRNKKSQKIYSKTCEKKKKAILKNAQEKDISDWFSTKKKHYKINQFCFYSV